MGADVLPTGIVAGSPGAVMSAPTVVTLNHGIAQVIAAGTYFLYATGVDMDLEIVTDPVAPTWTKMRDGADTQPVGYYFSSDGTNVRLRNSHATTDGETASLIKLG